MKQLRASLNVPFGLSQSKLLLTLGAKIIRTETELIFKSRNVIPERLINNDFKFKFNSIEDALNNLTK